MEKLKSPRVIALASTALFVGSLFWLLSSLRVNNTLEMGLDQERLRSEQLLSEKLLLDKDIKRLKDQLTTLSSKNGDLDRVVAEVRAQLKTREDEYERMKKQNVSLAQVRRQRDELSALRYQLENEITILRSDYAALEAKNSDLSQHVVALEERNARLRADLDKAVFAAVDRSNVQAVKRKGEKLTVRARKTAKLVASFEVPANFRDLSFRVSDPQGNILGPRDGSIAFTKSPSDETLTASSEAGVPGSKLQKVEVAFTPKNRLKTGIYTVEVLNENLYVGSLKVKLR